MHHDHIEALHMVRDLGLRLKPEDVAAVDVSVHPPFTDLRTVQTLVEKESHPGRPGRPALLGRGCRRPHRGGQPAHAGPAGDALRPRRATPSGAPCSACPTTTVAATLKAVLRHDMTPIVCVGETEERAVRSADRGELEEQVLAALEGLSPEQVGGLVVAYEPIWAIGTGQAATAVDAEDACVFIRAMVAKAGR